MIGLTISEKYNSAFDIPEENKKFNLYIFLDSKKAGVTYGRVTIEIEKY